jgi:hypothetical protein
MQPPEPKLASWLQVPGLVAVAPAQSPLQHDAPVKQRSPVAWQPIVPPALMQIWLSEQVLEQQSPSTEQPLPSVTQVAPVTGAQLPSTQSLEQQSPFCKHVLPLLTQPAIGQLPCVQDPVQHASPEPHGAAAPRQPPAAVHLWLRREQAPEQQSPAALQVPSIGAQIAPSPFRKGASPITSGASGWPPPSPPRVGLEDPPHATAPASTIAIKDLEVKAETEVTMRDPTAVPVPHRNPRKRLAGQPGRRTEAYTWRPKRFACYGEAPRYTPANAVILR